MDERVSAAAAMSQTASTGTKLKPGSLDDVGRAVLLLATEVAVLGDRQRVLEAVLAERGIEVADAVRDYQPSGEFAAALKAEKARLAQAMLEVLCPSG